MRRIRPSSNTATNPVAISKAPPPSAPWPRAFENVAWIATATRDGQISRFEIIPIDDEAGALRAFCRLVGGGDGAGGPVAALIHRLVAAFVARDWDRVEACFAPDLTAVDHRRVSALAVDLAGGEGIVERTRGLVALAADTHPSAEVLGELDGIVMVHISWSGHLDDGGGPFELDWRGVIMARDGVIVRYELFDPDDTAGMLAAVAQLRQ
jgi:ketosteroid isomerase-like protein